MDIESSDTARPAPVVGARPALRLQPPVPSPNVDPAPRTSGARAPMLSWQATPVRTLRLSNWLFRSSDASFIWLVVRLWLGYQWLSAGYQKIWGSERGFFWFGGGAAVKGFATTGVAGSASGKGGASYGWWAGFLHNFVIPNASWIAKVVTLAELLVGIALILGLLTGAAAFVGLALNFTYMFSGSAGVNPMYMLLGIFLLLAWQNAGLLGLDRYVLRNTWTPYRFGTIVGHLIHRRVPLAPVPH